MSPTTIIMKTIYHFKNTWSGLMTQIELDKEMLICDLKNTINEEIKIKLMVNNDYKIIITNLELMELAEPIDMNSTNKLKSLNNTRFYIRPENVPVPQNILERENRRIYQDQCSICYQNYSLDRFSYWRNSSHNTICSNNHNCCQNCIDSWTNTCDQRGLFTLCPFCRNIL